MSVLSIFASQYLHNVSMISLLVSSFDIPDNLINWSSEQTMSLTSGLYFPTQSMLDIVSSRWDAYALMRLSIEVVIAIFFSLFYVFLLFFSSLMRVGMSFPSTSYF